MHVSYSLHNIAYIYFVFVIFKLNVGLLEVGSYTSTMRKKEERVRASFQAKWSIVDILVDLFKNWWKDCYFVAAVSPDCSRCQEGHTPHIYRPASLTSALLWKMLSEHFNEGLFVLSLCILNLLDSYWCLLVIFWLNTVFFSNGLCIMT